MALELRRALTLPSLASCAALLMLLSMEGSARADAPGRDPYALLEELGRALVLVESEYVTPVPRERLLDGALRGLVAALDPHSSYLSPVEFKAFQEETSGSFAGIGVELDARDDELVVLGVFEEGPAARAGVRAGDHLLSIQGLPVRGARLDELIKKLRGPAGTTLRLGLQRPGVLEPLVFDLVREQLHARSVVGVRLPGGVAYLRIKQFQEGTHEELRTVLGQLEERESGPLRAAILDLRHDPGGLVDEARAVADECLDGGLIFSTRHQGKVLDEVWARAGGKLAKLPLTVLLSEYSASAAELVAGALQDHRRAELVGRPSFGKGSVQSIFTLPSGGGLRVTTARYYTPSGRSIQARGVMPDVLLEGPNPPAAVYGTVRESDLDGHLDGDLAPTRSPALTVQTPHRLQIAALDSLAREGDPKPETDPVLALALRRLRERMARSDGARSSVAGD